MRFCTRGDCVSTAGTKRYLHAAPVFYFSIHEINQQGGFVDFERKKVAYLCEKQLRLGNRKLLKRIIVLILTNFIQSISSSSSSSSITSDKGDSNSFNTADTSANFVTLVVVVVENRRRDSSIPVYTINSAEKIAAVSKQRAGNGYIKIII